MSTLNWMNNDNGSTTRSNEQNTMILHDRWEQAVAENPEAIAIDGENVHWTREELDLRADRVAHFLSHDRKFSPGDRVGLFCTQGENYVAAILGVLKAGCVVVPADRRMRWDKANQYISEGECAVILADKQGLAVCRNMGRQNVSALHDLVNDSSRSFSGPKLHLAGDSPAFIMRTSGTTGFPKAVQVTHQGLVNMVTEQIRLFGLLPSDRILLYSTINFDSSLAEMFTGLFSGACLVVAKSQEKSDVVRLRSFIKRNRVSVITIDPGLLEKFSPGDLAPLRVLVLAGTQLHYRQVKRFVDAVNCFNAYGLTETSVCVTCHRIDPQREYDSVVPIGKPLGNIDLCIMDHELQPVPKGGSGEICVSGIGISPGYLNNPGMTREKFVDNPFWKGDTLFRTGDMGRLLPDGNFEFLGRMEDKGGEMETEKENSEEKDPRIDIIMEHLAEEGYRPKIDDDGDIVFKREGRTYYILMANNKDQEYYRILQPSCWTIESPEEHTRALQAANSAAKSIKAAKIYVHDQVAEGIIEVFAATPENFNAVFERMMSALSSVASEFAQEMKSLADEQ